MKCLFSFAFLGVLLPLTHIANAQSEANETILQHGYKEVPWCRYCMLRKEVGDSTVFQNYTRDHFVLHEPDYRYFRKNHLPVEQTSYGGQADTSVVGYFSEAGMDLSGATAAAPIRKKVLPPVAKGGAVLVAGAGIWAATFAWGDEPLQHYTQSHHTLVSGKLSSVVQPLGRPGNMVPLAGAAFAGGLLLKDPKLQKAGLVSLGSILISSGMTNILKNEFHRYRPSETTENHYFGGAVRVSGNTSLPSAHTATAFAVATSVATVYGNEYKYVPPIAYGVATLVGFSRIYDNAHWATDVMAGAVVGYLSAKGANYLYDVANQKWKIRKQRRLLITPQPGIRSGGVSATLIF